MLGPTTKPFQARDATPNDTPARTANAIADLFSLATTEKDFKISAILGDEVLVSLSFPEFFMALNQNMNPIEMNSITKASWSASPQVEWETCAGMKAISQAATTPVDLPKLSLAIVAIGKIVSAP